MSSRADYDAMEMAIADNKLPHPTHWGTCRLCGKTFSRKGDFKRHWQLPITCQIGGCTHTVRDDHPEHYLNHHTHSHMAAGGRLVLTAEEIDTYFEETKAALGKKKIECLCEMDPYIVSRDYLATLRLNAQLDQDAGAPATANGIVEGLGIHRMLPFGINDREVELFLPPTSDQASLEERKASVEAEIAKLEHEKSVHEREILFHQTMIHDKDRSQQELIYYKDLLQNQLDMGVE